MNRTLTRLAALAVLLAASIAAYGQATLGREYLELSPPRPVSTTEQVEVIEFFYYGCPVCYEAQPHIARWLARVGPAARPKDGCTERSCITPSM
jgi:thiol:disulfide interchange protein DsbA